MRGPLALICALLAVLAVVGAASPVPSSGAGRAVSAGVSFTAGDPRPVSKTEQRVWRILLASALGTSPDVERLAARIHGLGKDALPLVVHLLCGELVHSQELDLEQMGEGVESDIGPQTLEHQRQILRSALGRWPAEDRLRELVKQGGAGDLDQKLAALALIGEVGGAQALAGLFEVLAGVESIYFRSPRLQHPSSVALTQILRSDSASYALLEKELLQARPEVLRMSIVALGKTGTARAMNVLPKLVGRDRAADLALLQVMGEMAERETRDVPSELTSLIRSMLYSSDARVARLATIALGKWNDLESIPIFVSMLRDQDPTRASAAHWSLGHMSGLELPVEPEPWNEWFEGEKAWHQDEGPALYEALESEDLSLVGGALTRLSAHRLHRHLSAARIAPLLTSENLNLARAVLTALVRLDSPRAVPWLIKALENSDNPSQRQRVTAALHSLTGLRMSDSQAWLELLADARLPSAEPMPSR